MGSHHICMMGENGQIPPFSKICSKKTLFRNLLGKYHFYGTQVWQNRLPFGTRV